MRPMELANSVFGYSFISATAPCKSSDSFEKCSTAPHTITIPKYNPTFVSRLQIALETDLLLRRALLIFFCDSTTH